ncbi:Membrane-anchored ubiquitin-fold protein 1 [Gracilariopsis chorda]|uniref:Membrane-anchored ubiquitin-fold protein 1 n=1 Tax=Gracilariopsis chorda TaxID=448386 RepID=A0A2V3J6V0_9FLOR|nr:Membrane-anchored ubiquitin-fold protein 1 [Gracilariopsis chorda]|eukprot:PXF49100.1 Membrane-anchored ubiquitin-fold protein 1 [Gracilariopsis chorda]
MDTEKPALSQADTALTDVDSSPAVQNSSCDIRFLMVNGTSFRLTVPASSTIHDVKDAVIQHRPKELADFLKDTNPNAAATPTKVDDIRVLHLGKFLDDVKTLKECNFNTATNEFTTVHLSVRVPSNPSDEVKDKFNKKKPPCCQVM